MLRCSSNTSENYNTLQLILPCFVLQKHTPNPIKSMDPVCVISAKNFFLLSAYNIFRMLGVYPLRKLSSCSVLRLVRRSPARRNLQVLKLSSKLIVLCHEQKISIHIVERVKNCCIYSDSNRRTSLLYVPKSCPADSRTL